MKYFITGIGTGVGKTIASAIVTEALKADYWKPVQAGDLDNSDTLTVKNLVSNRFSTFHNEGFRLKTPVSPHVAAALENLEIIADQVSIPKTENILVIEGAGGVMAPLNNTQTMLDLMRHTNAEIILVSAIYLGSINHTLLSWEVLKAAGLRIRGIIFNGDENPETEKLILDKTGLPCLLRIKHEKTLNKDVVQQYAAMLNETWE